MRTKEGQSAEGEREGEGEALVAYTREACEGSGFPSYAPVQELAFGQSGEFCTNCGIRTETHWKFCLECGAKTGGGPVVAPIPEYTSEGLTQPGAAPKLRNSGELMKSESKERFETRVVDLVVKESDNEFVRVGHRLFYDFERQPNCCGECNCCDTVYGVCYDGCFSNDEVIYRDESCPFFCGKEPFVGCHSNVKLQLPRALEEKGITAEEWREWFGELDTIQSNAPDAWSEWVVRGCPLFWLAFFPMLIVVFFWNLFCPLSSEPCCFGDWHSQLRLWLRKVNAKLEPFGSFAKIRTYRFWPAPLSAANYGVIDSGIQKFKDEANIDCKYLHERIHRHYPTSANAMCREAFQFSVLVFALNAEETRKLKMEPILESSFGLADWRRVC